MSTEFIDLTGNATGDWKRPDQQPKTFDDAKRAAGNVALASSYDDGLTKFMQYSDIVKQANQQAEETERNMNIGLSAALYETMKNGGTMPQSLCPSMSQLFGRQIAYSRMTDDGDFELYSPVYGKDKNGNTAITGLSLAARVDPMMQNHAVANAKLGEKMRPFLQANYNFIKTKTGLTDDQLAKYKLDTGAPPEDTSRFTVPASTNARLFGIGTSNRRGGSFFSSDGKGHLKRGFTDANGQMQYEYNNNGRWETGAEMTARELEEAKLAASERMHKAKLESDERIATAKNKAEAEANARRLDVAERRADNEEKRLDAYISNNAQREERLNKQGLLNWLAKNPTATASDLIKVLSEVGAQPNGTQPQKSAMSVLQGNAGSQQPVGSSKPVVTEEARQKENQRRLNNAKVNRNEQTAATVDTPYDERYNTILEPNEEAEYQDWKQSLPKALQSERDYDLRGYFKENGGKAFKDGDHMPDTFKKPNHPTFSVESRYATGKNKALAGTWNGDTYVPPAKTDDSPMRQIKSRGLEQEFAQYVKDEQDRVKRAHQAGFDNVTAQSEEDLARAFLESLKSPIIDKFAEAATSVENNRQIIDDATKKARQYRR